MNKFPAIPGYEVKKFLGSGGTADVFMAVPTGKSRVMAIKTLSQNRFSNSQPLKRFLKEAQTISDLHHPNIVRIYEVGNAGRLHFMVMEYLPESLKQRLRNRRKIPPEEALTITVQIAEALYHAHARGYIHRDVKPDNIMFRSDGTPVILDFGIARVLDATTQITVTGAALGTPRYMSPEQIRAQKVDGRSDIYSLGVVLFEMLAGKPPYKGSNTISVTFKHVAEPIPRLPRDLSIYQPVIDRMMDKDKTRRPGSEEEWRRLIVPVMKPFTLPPAELSLKDRGAESKNRERTKLGTGTQHSKTIAPPKPILSRRQPQKNPPLLWKSILVLAIAILIYVNLDFLGKVWHFIRRIFSFLE